MSEHIEEYLPSPLLWRVFLMFVLVNVLATAFVVNVPLRSVISYWVAAPFMYGIVIGIAVASATVWKGADSTWREVFERYRTHNRIGYQRVWMLDENKNLTSRIERRDCQNAQRNTSEYALYEKLGGWGGRRYELCRRFGAFPEYQKCQYLRITSMAPSGVRVRGRYAIFPFDATIDIQVFLRVANLTEGNDVPGALAKLASECISLMNQADAMEKLCNKRGEETRSRDREIQELKKELASAEKGWILASRATDYLNRIVDLSKTRDARVSDLRRLAFEARAKLKQ